MSELGIVKRTRKSFDTIYVKDFGDDYHKAVEESMMDIRAKARSILALYYNLEDYMEAQDIYKDYVRSLITKYGGIELFKVMKNCRLITDFIPPQPKLKMTENTKMALEYGVIKSNSFDKLPQFMRNDIINKAKGMLDDFDENELIVLDGSVIDDVQDSSQVLVNAYINESQQLSESQSKKSGSGFALFESFQRGRQDKQEDSSPVLIPGFSDIMDDEYDESLWFIKESERPSETEFVFINGKHVTRSQAEEYKLVKLLEKIGWEHEAILGYGDTNDSTIGKMFRREVELSKEEKRRARKKSTRIENVSKDNVLDIINADLGGNFSSYEEYEADMLNMISPDFQY